LFKALNIFLVEKRAQRGEGSGIILLGDNAYIGVVVLQSIALECIGL
jgi:hypothetical protein